MAPRPVIFTACFAIPCPFGDMADTPTFCVCRLHRSLTLCTLTDSTSVPCDHGRQRRRRMRIGDFATSSGNVSKTRASVSSNTSSFHGMASRCSKTTTVTTTTTTTMLANRDPPNNDDADDVIDTETLFLRGPVPGDRVVRTMSANGQVSARVLSCTGLVAGAARLHRTSPIAAAAFGRTLTCALLLAAGKKDGETLQIEVRGDGPIRGITAIANGEGHVRGYLGNPLVVLPPKSDGNLDVGRAVGKGIIAVVRNSPFAKQPYTGLVPLVSGEIAEDVASYLADSEQTPSALGAGVYVSDMGEVTAAGGYLVQLLPDASEETISTVERNVKSLPPPSELVRQGLSPDEICFAIMRDLSPLDLASTSPRYYCECTTDRLKRTVALIPEIEVYDLLASQGKIEATCEFCGRRWELLRPDIDEIFMAKNTSALDQLSKDVSPLTDVEDPISG